MSGGLVVRRPALLVAALAFFAYEQWAFYQWMQQHGTVSAGLAHAWMTLRQDPMVFMAWNDMGIFTAMVLVWLWRDIRATLTPPESAASRRAAAPESAPA
jgi:hypothetical protein